MREEHTPSESFRPSDEPTERESRPGGRLSGRVGIVTGAGKGLGRAFALDLAAAGATVIVNNRNRVVDADGRGPADHVVAEITATGGTAVAEYSDVADPAAAPSMLDAAISRFGRIDFLVTSAGVAQRQMFHKSTPGEFDIISAVNLGGSAHIAMLAATAMRQAGFGRIVLIASGAGLHGEPTAVSYSATKGGIIAMGRAMNSEGASRNVYTNVLLPYASTQMTEGMQGPLVEVMAAEVVAPVVTALVAPESTLSGEVLVSCGGGLRATSPVEWSTVMLPGGAISSSVLADLVAASRGGAMHTYPDAMSAFLHMADEVTAAR